MTTQNDDIWLTQEAFDRLTAELDELKGPRRTEISERIAAARDEGDLKENGGYHAAREEQSKMEGRILELEHLLKTATVGAAPQDDGVVESGMVVTVEMMGRERTFLIGNREIAGDSDVEVFSAQSPLGQAIAGSRVGDTVDYTAPNGKDIAVKIVAATPFAA